VLTSPDRAHQQDVGGRLQVAAGGQFIDEPAVGRLAKRSRPANRRAALASTSMASSRSIATVRESPSVVTGVVREVSVVAFQGAPLLGGPLVDGQVDDGGIGCGDW